MADGGDDGPARPVGYKSPPLEGRFKKGRSGNPKGRPRKKKAEEKKPFELLDEALRKRVSVKGLDGQPQSMTTLEAFVHSLVVRALRGDKGATRDLLSYLRARGDLTPPPQQQRVGVVVVGPRETKEQWLAKSRTMTQPLNALEGLPGIDPDMALSARPRGKTADEDDQ